MSPSESPSADTSTTALKLGPRKKRYVCNHILVNAFSDAPSVRHGSGATQSSRTSDPLVHYGRHFGRTVHAMCNVQALVTNGILRMGDDADVPEEMLTSEYTPFHYNYSVTALTQQLMFRCRREGRVFQRLVRIVPHLADRLMECSTDEAMAMADLARLPACEH
jgi:hypothetical protein